MKESAKILKVLKKTGSRILQTGEDGLSCMVSRERYYLMIIVSWGEGWDHISIHAQVKGKNHEEFTPFWEDMCLCKQLFFKDSETVIQYHPPKSKYINNHPYTLHLWRQQNKEIELPPSDMV